MSFRGRFPKAVSWLGMEKTKPNTTTWELVPTAAAAFQ